MFDLAIKGVILCGSNSLHHFTITYPLSYPESSKLTVTLHDNSVFSSSDLPSAVETIWINYNTHAYPASSL